MGQFKSKPGNYEHFDINEKRYLDVTGKQLPYCNVEKITGREILFAVCPNCDNPIEIVGLYKKPLYGDKPYGKHYPHDVPGLACYDQARYNSCPRSNPDYREKRLEANADASTTLAIKKRLRDNFDKAIYIISKNTGISISNRTAREMLDIYVNNEGWLYRNAYEYNIPWTIAEADRSRSLYNNSILKNGNLCKALQKYPELNLVDDPNRNGFVKITSKNGYFDFNYVFQEHTIKLENGLRNESICFRVTKGRAPNPQDVYTSIIQIKRNAFINLCQTEHIRSKSELSLVDYAQKLIPA